MSLANADVVTALFESYLNIRKNNWALNVEDPFKTSLSYKSAPKFEICVDCIRRIKKVNSTQERNELFHDLVSKSQAELIKATETRDWFLGLGRFFADRPLLLETLCAALSYINSEVNKSIASNQTQDKIPQVDLDAFHEILTKLAAVNGHTSQADNYFQFHYEQIIKVRDSETTTLGEKSFSEFEENVASKKRTLVICSKLLENKEALVPDLSSTAIVNSATSLASSSVVSTPALPEISSAHPDTSLTDNKPKPAPIPSANTNAASTLASLTTATQIASEKKPDTMSSMNTGSDQIKFRIRKITRPRGRNAVAVPVPTNNADTHAESKYSM